VWALTHGCWPSRPPLSATYKTDAKKAESSSSSEDEGESKTNKDWVVVRDPHGRLCW